MKRKVKSTFQLRQLCTFDTIFDRKFIGFIILMFTTLSLNAQLVNSATKNQNLVHEQESFQTKQAFSDSSKFYLRSMLGEPWTQTNQYSNVGIMDSVFGEEEWTLSFFETVDVDVLFSPSVSIIFIDGGDDGALAFSAFMASNQILIEDWVFNGGRLFLNAAPNEGGNIDLGFNGTVLNYGPDLITHVSVSNEFHEISQGPNQPVEADFVGDYFAHAFISGDQLNGILLDTTDLERPVLAEKFWGEGLVLFGGLTSTQWHLPLVESLNYKKNILSYLSTYFPCTTELICPDDITVNLDGSCCSTEVYFDEPYTDGNCEAPIIQVDGISSGAYFGLGITVNSFEAINMQGDTSYCSFEVLVLDPNDVNGVGIYHTVSGMVYTENMNLIEGAQLSVNEGYLSTETNQDGYYTFEASVLDGSQLDIDISYDTYLTDGVTSLDLSLITRHILGVESLDSPYKLIAADVNNSKSISTLDIILIQKAILQINDSFPNVESWKFIPADQELELANPWAYQDHLNIDLVISDTLVNFIAIKMGDVSNSVN